MRSLITLYNCFHKIQLKRPFFVAQIDNFLTSVMFLVFFFGLGKKYPFEIYIW